MADRREHCEGLQYEMNDDLVLYLYLLSPTPVQRDKLLLRSQTIVQDTLDAFQRKRLKDLGK